MGAKRSAGGGSGRLAQQKRPAPAARILMDAGESDVPTGVGRLPEAAGLGPAEQLHGPQRRQQVSQRVARRLSSTTR